MVLYLGRAQRYHTLTLGVAIKRCGRVEARWVRPQWDPPDGKAGWGSGTRGDRETKLG